jgi:hypothetical protein
VAAENVNIDGAMEVLRDLRYEDADEIEHSVLELFAAKLQEVSDAVKATGSDGSATLKIKIKTERKHSKTTQSIEPDISTSMPKQKLGGIIRFNRDGRLSRSDSRQPELPLRTVATGNPEARDVAVGEPQARRV